MSKSAKIMENTPKPSKNCQTHNKSDKNGQNHSKTSKTNKIRPKRAKIIPALQKTKKNIKNMLLARDCVPKAQNQSKNNPKQSKKQTKKNNQKSMFFVEHGQDLLFFYCRDCHNESLCFTAQHLVRLLLPGVVACALQAISERAISVIFKNHNKQMLPILLQSSS